MSKTNLLATAALATALGTASHAAPPKDGMCADNQTTTVSAVHGVIACNDMPSTGLPEVFTPRSETRAPALETTIGGVNSKFGQGSQAGVQWNLDRVSVAANGIVTPDELRILATVGLRLTPELALIAGVGGARENAGKAFDNERFASKDIEGKSAYIRAEYALPRESVIAKAFVEYMRATGKTVLLDTTYANSISTRSEDFAAFVRTIQTTHFDTTQTSFIGDTIDTLRGGATLHVGKNGQVTLTAGALKDRNGTRAITGVTGEYFGGEYKLSASALGSRGSSTVGARIETLLPQVSKGLSAYAEVSSTRIPGAKTNNIVSAGLSYLFGNAQSYTRPQAGSLDLAGSVRSLASDHISHGVGSVAALGEVVSITTRRSTEKSNDAAKMPESVTVKNTKINPDGSVTIDFDKLSPWAYECMIDGKNLVTCSSPWTTSVLTPGAHTLSIRSVNNALKGDTPKSPWTEAKVNIYTDILPEIFVPKIVKIGYTSVDFQYSIDDKNGIRNQVCTVGNQSVSPDKNRNCHFDGLKPGTRYDAITTAEVAKQLPDGALVWEPAKVSTPFTTDIATDASTKLVEPTILAISYISVDFQYNITDPDGLRNRICTVDGKALSPDASGKCHFEGLTPGKSYEAITTGEVAERTPDNSLIWKSVKTSRIFITAAAIDAPTLVTLDATNITTNSLLALCNITDLDGATGACTLRNKATGALVDSWTIGVARTITGLTKDTDYTLALIGTSTRRNLDNTSTSVAVNRLQDFRTLLPANTPLALGNITCTATSYTVGSTTTCSVTPVDIDGISSVTATIDGVAVPVTASNGTYRTTLSGLSVGTHSLVWTAIGKMPNGSLESPQMGTQNIDVKEVPNEPGSIGAPTLESKTSTSINTAPGSVRGMTNVRVSLYGNASLTTLIATNTSGDFTGLIPTTTYYVVTVGDDLNETTGIIEVKKSPALAVTTNEPLVLVPGAPVLSASVSGSTVTLTCPSVSGATGYDFYQGSTLLGSSTTCNYTINGLADGTYTFTAKAKNTAGSSVASNSQTVNIISIPTGPALSNVGPLLDHGGNPITFNLNALVGLPAGSQVVGVVGFPLVDDIAQATALSCNTVGVCTVIYDVDVGGIGFRKTFPVTVKVRVPGYTQTLDRPLSIIIENEF